MANQATSRSDDLMVGAGALFFARSDDPNGLHHLGNVSEFNITTDVTTVEKNSAMDKDRELMASVVTAVNPTGSLTMNEYNPYNLALGLYGREGVFTQTGGAFTNQAYTIPSVPGIIELTDAQGNRYMNVTGVSVGLASSTPATLLFDTYASGLHAQASAAVANTVAEAVHPSGTSGVGTITLTNVGTNTTASTYMVQIEEPPTAPGDLGGMLLNIMGGSISGVAVVTVPAGTTYTYSLGTDGDMVFSVGTNTASDTDPAFEKSTVWSKIVFQPSTASGVEGTDYLANEQMLRAGVIQIPSGSSFTKGQQVFINFTAPEREFITVSGGDAGEIQGRLLFIGDPNIGGQYTIEGWKVKVTPDGDLTGLIGEDFGEFTLQVRFLSDKQNHPKNPYYRVTHNGRADGSNVNEGVYDPEY